MEDCGQDKLSFRLGFSLALKKGSWVFQGTNFQAFQGFDLDFFFFEPSVVGLEHASPAKHIHIVDCTLLPTASSPKYVSFSVGHRQPRYKSIALAID